jgi:hypothetical protein
VFSGGIGTTENTLMPIVEAEVDAVQVRMSNPWSVLESPEEFWADLGTHGRQLLKTLLERTLDARCDEWVRVGWHEPAVGKPGATVTTAANAGTRSWGRSVTAASRGAASPCDRRVCQRREHRADGLRPGGVLEPQARRQPMSRIHRDAKPRLSNRPSAPPIRHKTWRYHCRPRVRWRQTRRLAPARPARGITPARATR